MVASAAPRLDLEFWENVQHFSKSDPEMSEAVNMSIYRHMWYLSEELVSLCLCDTATSNDDKAELIKVMLSVGRPREFIPKKPVMKKNLLIDHIPGEVKLQDFIGQRSWILIDRLDVKVDWMNKTPEDWHQYPEYVCFIHLLRSLKVAERAIKDMTEYLNYSRDDER